MKAEDWIKVTNKLPEYDETVLVAYHWEADDEFTYMFSHRPTSSDVRIDENGFAFIDKRIIITHWMPIMPPKN